MKSKIAWLLTLLLVVVGIGTANAALPQAQRTPVILNTDIGDDIDDTWALVMLLKSPELDPQLITTTHGKAVYRAKLIARILETAERTDIPIGLGAGGHDGTGRQEAWVENYDLKKYPGKIFLDGVRALVDIVMKSEAPITIISIGPSTTVAAALDKRPPLASQAIFVGMQGAVRNGYDGGPVGPEYNVKENVPGARRALLAPWIKTTITPLDTCGLVRLNGQRFQDLAKSDDPLIKAVLENYRIWAQKETLRDLTASSVLFDTVAIYLALPGDKPEVRMENLAINITEDGRTVIDRTGAKMSVATAWRDLNRYEDFLLSVLLSRKR